MTERYINSSGKSFTDDYIIDLNVVTGATYLIEKDIHDLTKEFIQFRGNDELQGDVSYIKNTYNSDDIN
ncbi:hypothetical protein CV093_03500 [Oceanobacillus sp. 143]|uniref:Uncharacterized protein n=1 Tax=Oceanobacillus zhaokaii TaxID=2052660 RepID=A0A345PDI8_9BACI|nr:hypothetical protein [Oceanobacillus zhaokaii]AXI08068.1 hypothetical protein CUC15_03405 [Oceanobacillus zhaokaii]QGS68054.1 hypothetical protein CV093_03500 [Oceanobacillus sp. 143]